MSKIVFLSREELYDLLIQGKTLVRNTKREEEEVIIHERQRIHMRDDIIWHEASVSHTAKDPEDASYWSQYDGGGLGAALLGRLELDGWEVVES